MTTSPSCFRTTFNWMTRISTISLCQGAIALIDQAAADMARGNAHTMDETRDALARTRDAWLAITPAGSEPLDRSPANASRNLALECRTLQFGPRRWLRPISGICYQRPRTSGNPWPADPGSLRPSVSTDSASIGLAWPHSRFSDQRKPSRRAASISCCAKLAIRDRDRSVFEMKRRSTPSPLPTSLTNFFIR